MAATGCLRTLARVYSAQVALKRMAAPYSACIKQPNCQATFTRSLCQAASADRDHYDVAVVGGGMVGAAFACGLATSSLTKDLRISIVDTQELSKIKLTELDSVPDPRTVAITCGAWKAITKRRHASFDTMQVWDYAGQGYVRYHASDVGQPRLGYLVENRVLISALYDRLQDLASVDLICPDSVENIEWPATSSTSQDRPVYVPPPSSSVGVTVDAEDWALLRLGSGRQLRARLVVGADGGRSKVRQLAGLKTTGWEYDQRAVISTVEVDRPHATAWQRFLPTGPLALLPLGNNFSNIVWSTSAEMAKQLQEANDAQFAEAVNNALVHDHAPLPSTRTDNPIQRLLRAASFSASGDEFQVPPRVTGSFSPRMSFPLILNHAATYVQPRLALIGDAAHTVHPLAGQGVNLGFGDASQLVKSLCKACEDGGDIGEQSVLAQYDFERRRANVAMMAALDGLHRVFKVQWGPFSVARNLGLAAVQFSGPLKRQFMRVAMGM
eukprot:SM000129S26169  [mRNA]  locus=s129:383717:387222:- [translate_table: standard]